MLIVILKVMLVVNAVYVGVQLKRRAWVTPIERASLLANFIGAFIALLAIYLT